MDAVMNWLWQGGVVAVATSVMLLAMARASATARYAVCWAASLLILALPVLPFLPFPPLLPSMAFPPLQPLLPLLPSPPVLPQTDAVVSLPDAWWTSPFVIGGAWLFWVGIQLARFMSAAVAIRHARARSRAFPAHLQAVLRHWRRVGLEGRQPRLVLSNAVTSAAVFGWGRPMIAVSPSLVRTLQPEDLDRVLIHEWAHVQRRDDVANVVQIVVRIIAGWHPALWWIDRRLHIEREIACDEIAVAITGAPKSYAECLMKISAAPRTPMAMLMAPAVFASGLRARIVKIVSPRPLLAPPRSRGLAAGIVLLLCVVSVVVGRRTLVDATAFAEPLVSAGIETLGIPSHPPVPDSPVFAARPVTDPQLKRPSRQAPDRSSADQQTYTEPPLATPQAPPSSVEQAGALPSPDESKTADVVHVSSEVPPPPATVVPEVTSVPETPRPQAAVSAPSAQSPWSAAAAGGVAIGRTSKDAGVATAGFFTRVARRVAGSF